LSNRVIRIGSRGSDLALWQANFFMGELDAIGVSSELIIITTKGDKIQNLSFDKIEGKGFFTKEIEDHLLDDKIDIAIHSHKDLETESPPGLSISGVSYREDPAELLLIRKESVDRTLDLEFKKGAVVGTSSARRKAQINSLRPDITLKDIRGNVPTRIKKLRDGQFDAIMLAKAGVNRLNLDVSDLYAVRVDERKFIPAPAQGVLAYQCREDDSEMHSIITQMADEGMAHLVKIERAILNKFGGGCHKPIGAYAHPAEGGYKVRVTYAQDWEDTPRRVSFVAKDSEEARIKFEALQNKSLPTSVFISRDLSDESFLKRQCQLTGVRLEDQPLIKVKSLEFELPESFDCVFFSSRNSVREFFRQSPISVSSGVTMAAFGESTAKELSHFVNEIAFIGSGSDSALVAQNFKEFLGNRSVLFPISEQSLRTIQSSLDLAQVKEVICYSTTAELSKIEPVDCYVFTSPSNVESFFTAGNSIGKSKVIAIGPSTEKALKKHNIDSLSANIPDETELWTLIAS